MSKLKNAAAAGGPGDNEANQVRVGFGEGNPMDNASLLILLGRAKPSTTKLIFSGAHITDSVLKTVGDWIMDHPNIQNLAIEHSSKHYTDVGMRKFCHALKYNGLEQVSAEGFIDPLLASQMVEEYSRLHHAASVKDAAVSAAAAGGAEDPHEIKVGWGVGNPVDEQSLRYILSQAKPAATTLKFFHATVTDLILRIVGPWISEHKNIKSLAVHGCEKGYSAAGMKAFCDTLKVNGLVRVDARDFIESDVASEIVGKYMELHPDQL